MQSCIILHNICVEDREGPNGTSLPEQPISDAIINGSAAPLWTDLRSSLRADTALAGSFSALWATSANMKDHQEYMKTRTLIMDHP